MAYIDLDTDICKNKFDIFSNDSDENYKIMYIHKERKMGILKRITAYIPIDSPFLYTQYDCDNDSEYLEVQSRPKGKNQLSEIYTSISDLKKNCYVPVYAIPTTTLSNKYYYIVKSTDKTEQKKLVIRKSRKNIWEVCSPIKMTNSAERYMDVVFNFGLDLRKNKPDNINIYMPRNLNSKINFRMDKLCALYHVENSGVIGYKNRYPHYNTRLDSYVLDFKISPGELGIPSQKNSSIIRIGQKNNTKSLMEVLKISRNIISIIYKTPFSTLHAFGYGVARAHTSKRRDYF